MHQHIQLRNWVGLVASGDHAIDEVCKDISAKGITTLIVADQGGWLSYPKYAKKHGLQVEVIKTHYGIINPQTIPHIKNAALMVNSLAAYAAPQPMEAIESTCKKHAILLINDASGSVGTDNATYGDIILGSFGKHKPVNAYYGGFLTCDTPMFIDNSFDRETPAITDTEVDTLGKRELITYHLDRLHERLDFLYAHHWKIKQDLKAHRIIHHGAQGINVIITYLNDTEKESIIDYCKTHGYEWTPCPREIRILEQGISIEVKRLVDDARKTKN